MKKYMLNKPNLILYIQSAKKDKSKFVNFLYEKIICQGLLNAYVEEVAF